MGYIITGGLQKVNSFSLTLFSTDPDFIKNAVAAGVNAIIVDWERAGKARRQIGADTEIRRDTLADLQRVRACTQATLICRINPVGSTTEREIEQAIATDVDEILVPMVRDLEAVESVLKKCEGRCGVGILVETRAALGILDELASMPLSRVYVGLNDLAIDLGERNIFTAILDGTVETVRRHFAAPFGFGGLTLSDRGYPIACRLLIGEMARLNCTFSFLRRSFHRDIKGRDLKTEIPRLLRALQEARLRSSDGIAADRHELERAIMAVPGHLLHSSAAS